MKNRGNLFSLVYLLGLAAAFSVAGFVNEPQALAWTVERVEGESFLQADSRQTKGKKAALPNQPAAAGHLLKKGDLLLTNAAGRILLKEGESELWLGGDSELKLLKNANPDEGETGLFQVLKGKVRAKFKRPSGPQAFPYEVRSRSVVASVRGTEFIVANEKNEERVATLEGLVRVSGVKTSGEFWDVSAGHVLMIIPNEMPKVRETRPALAEQWKKETTF